MKSNTLKQFCTLHATPGDETDVFNALMTRWKAQGLDVTQIGNYAVFAQPGERKKSDTVLLIAHADSPGFIVDAVISETEVDVVVLGGIAAPKYEGTPLLLKTSEGLIPCSYEAPNKIRRNIFRILKLHKALNKEEQKWTRSKPLRVKLERPCSSVQKGDRLAWAPSWEEKDDFITSPFLDNRIACALVADWYDKHAALLSDVNVIVAATAMEEVTGFGANVLAHAVHADAVIALDITYESERQKVKMGKGPVITLSDTSVILSPQLRDRLLTAPIPLQTEVYNYAGTDARAFPAQGIPTTVIPLLLATDGNHSPRETIAVADLEAWPNAIAAVTHLLFDRSYKA